MVFDFLNIVYGLITAAILVFSKYIYRSLKSLIIKEKPKVLIHYVCKWRSTYGTNPRNYKFVTNLTIQNIDVFPIYDIEVFLIDNDEKTKIKSVEFLDKSAKIEENNEIIIQYGDTGNLKDEAKQQLPSSIKSPTFLVFYKNKKGKKYKIQQSYI